MYKVKFVVLTKVNKNNSTVKLVGNLPVLGNWNPLNGLEMEEYDEGQWESVKHIQIPNGQQFQFKIVRIFNNNAVEWEELPNNLNRKFKPKYHTKLILTWSSHIGKALNEARSSLKLKGLPGVMVKGNNQPGMLKRKPQKNKKNVLYDSESSEDENENDSFCVGRKKSTDIRESINSGDIQQIYYDTTQLEIAYQNYKQIQINLVYSHSKQNDEFLQKIQNQLQELYELENFKFKWLVLNDCETQGNKIHRKIGYKKLQKIVGEEKIRIQNYAVHNIEKNHFIFLDLHSALNSDIQNASACLYLSSNEFEEATQYLNDLQKFQFICFDDPETNKKLLKLFQQKKQEQDQKHEKEEERLEQLTQKKSQRPKSDKQIQFLSLEKIIEQLQFCRQAETPINTVVHSFTKQQALSNILENNQIIFIDSQIMKADKKFFEKLINGNFEKRLIIIIHKVGAPEWIHNFDSQKNVCVILDNFSKLYLLGKIHDTTKKHKNAMNIIQMRIKLFEKQFGGSWSSDQNFLIFKFKQNTSTERTSHLKAQLEIVLKEYNYFKVNMKEHKLKISWNLSHPVRLLRTLIRLKFIEQGKIGNFYIVSQNENFNELKQQIRLLINTNTLYMKEGKNTKIYDYGFGKQNNAKYVIKNQENQEVNSLALQTTGDIERRIDRKQKKKQFLEKCFEVL